MDLGVMLTWSRRDGCLDGWILVGESDVLKATDQTQGVFLYTVLILSELEHEITRLHPQADHNNYSMYPISHALSLSKNPPPSVGMA